MHFQALRASHLSSVYSSVTKDGLERQNEDILMVHMTKKFHFFANEHEYEKKGATKSHGLANLGCSPVGLFGILLLSSRGLVRFCS